jgi:hypothetical protein
MKTILPLIGAGAFGVLVGWFVYYINRYRKGDVQFSDLTTLIGIIGGGSVMAIFKGGDVNEQEMFGAYGIGLFLGFFGYFVLLLTMIFITLSGVASLVHFDGKRHGR